MSIALSAVASADDGVSVKRLAELPNAIGGHGGGMVRGTPVVAGGTSWTADKQHKVWNDASYVFAGGHWSPGPKLPTPLADMAFACDEHGLYLAGGTTGKDVVSAAVYHLADTTGTANWERLTDLPEPIEAAIAAVINRTLYMVGGYSRGGVSNRVWSLDLTDPKASWRPRSPLPAPGRGWAAMAAADGKLTHFGGFASPPYQKDVALFADAHQYDPANDRWIALPKHDLPGYAWSAANADGGSFLLVGRAPDVGKTSDEVWIVHPVTGVKYLAGKLPTPNCCMAVIPTGPGVWLLTGGEPDTTRVRSAATTEIRLNSSKSSASKP